MLWELQHHWNRKIEDIDWSAFSALWPLAENDPPKDMWGIKSGPCRLSDEEVVGLMHLGFELKPVPYPGAMLTKMQDRAKWETSTGISPEHLNAGQAVHIAIPDIGLLKMRAVTVKEDFCTDALQDLLDEGWRILAVCPPNAARRPDYILGHADPKADRGR